MLQCELNSMVFVNFDFDTVINTSVAAGRPGVLVLLAEKLTPLRFAETQNNEITWRNIVICLLFSGKGAKKLSKIIVNSRFIENN